MFIRSYSEPELYEIWSNFSGEVDAVQVLSDFIGIGDNRNKAKELIAKFEIRRETATLNGASRGIADRQRKHV